MQSGSVECYSSWWQWLSKFMMNVSIDDDLLWWHALVMLTFHHAHCVSTLRLCRNPVIKCCKPDDIWVCGELFIMMTMIIDVFNEYLDWCCILMVIYRWWSNILSRRLYVSVILLSKSGDTMLKIWWPLSESTWYPKSYLWASIKPMKIITYKYFSPCGL